MQRTGWAYGLLIGSREWLTIPGSAYTTPALAPAPDQAVKPPGRAHEPWALARVEEVDHPGVTLGCAYRVLELRDETGPTAGTVAAGFGLDPVRGASPCGSGGVMPDAPACPERGTLLVPVAEGMDTPMCAACAAAWLGGGR